MAWLQANWPALVASLFAVSEGLALIPSVKANSVFQLIFNALQSLVNKDKPQA